MVLRPALANLHLAPVGLFEWVDVDDSGKLSIKELEQLEAVQVMATRRTRKQKDVMVQAELARLERRVAKLEEERKCKICLERPADHVFIPCGHRCCAACLPKVRQAAKCHICRQAVNNAVRFYSS